MVRPVVRRFTVLERNHLMQLGMVGLGRMGANLVRRLVRDGHTCVVFDVDAGAVSSLAAESDAITGTSDLEVPKTAWVMVPAAYAGGTIMDLADRMESGDVVIDGGNTYYRDDVDRAETLGPKGIHYVDVGTSGGVFGLDRGFCLMIGGEDDVVARLEPIFRTIAPGPGDVDRTPGRTGDHTPEEEGWLHCGPPGAGHFVKMVHNGIEYGLMAAYAEGLNILRHANAGKLVRENDAETTPLREPKYYQYDIDTEAVAEVWRRGSVVASWLLDLTAAALVDDPNLDSFAGRVSDSGEGRWTSLAAIDVGAPAPILTTSLYERFTSRGEADYADKLLSAMRKQFGGHDEKPVSGG
jgi:6-phosphogluconate dehydrogenase